MVLGAALVKVKSAFAVNFFCKSAIEIKLFPETLCLSPDTVIQVSPGRPMRGVGEVGAKPI